MELFSPPRENFLYFRKRKPRKKFLYFLKKNAVFMFWKMENSKKFFIFREELPKPEKPKFIILLQKML